MTPAIATFGLRKEYPGGGGLHGVDLEVPSGSVYGLIGPNGAGKTTLLSLLVGLRHPDAGEVRLSVSPQHVAVSQDVPEFEPWLTAREVVTVAADLAGTPIAGARADRVLHETGLAAVAERRVGGFSRGMTQRLALATTLVTDPAIVIFDEPSAALDPAGRHEVLDLVAHLGRDRTVLLSSHILADVQRVCDTVGVLIDGRLRYQGPLSRLLAEHVRPAWNVRVRGDPAAVIAALETRDWVQHVSAVRGGQLRVEVTSFQAGERYLVPALADVGVPVIAVEPAADDLDDAFLRLTGAISPPEEVTG